MIKTTINYLPLFDSSGVYRTDTQGLSSPEDGLYVVAGSKPRETSPRSGAPGWAADNRGHYRDQHQPEESDPDLLMEDGHDNATQIVVMLFTAKRCSAGEEKQRN